MSIENKLSEVPKAVLIIHHFDYNNRLNRRLEIPPTNYHVLAREDCEKEISGAWGLNLYEQYCEVVNNFKEFLSLEYKSKFIDLGAEDFAHRLNVQENMKWATSILRQALEEKMIIYYYDQINKKFIKLDKIKEVFGI